MLPPVKNLEKWYFLHARKLPWRETQDPYAIWVSEVMLQQTQVTTVIPYYHRFLEKFPTLESLAHSSETEVIHLWSGLGYYSRARNLRLGAQHLVKTYPGKFPRTRERILEVPGIGPYTAGAILSIAFDLPVPLVDGNVLRFFSRYYAITKTIEEKSVQKQMWELATEWVNKAKSPRQLNQALMELGATVCTKGSPQCDRCPVQNSCKALKKGLQTSLPIRRARRQVVELHWASLVISKEEKFYLVRNSNGQWWNGLWDFPRQELNQANDLEKFEISLRKKKAVQRLSRITRKKHTVTHHKLHVTALRLEVNHWPGNGKWLTRKQITALPTSSLFQKIWSELPH